MRSLLFLPAALLLACPRPADDSDVRSDAGLLQPPDVTSVTPAFGSSAGGTAVVVAGTNFEQGLELFFGTGKAVGVVVETKRRVSALTPPGVAGAVDVVVVNPDGQTATLAAAFTYQPEPAKVIDESVLLNAADAKETSGNDPVLVDVLSEVSVPGLTLGQGQGAGVRAQVGYSEAIITDPLDPSAFTWVDASYVGDADGPNLGELARDRYAGQVSLGGAQGAQTRRYLLAARFSLDDGATWTIADRDGSANGTAAAQLAAVDVTRPLVDWCKLGGQLVEAPPQVRLKVGQAGVVVYGQVYKLNVTNQSGVGAGIAGQLGYGAVGTDPATWTWVDATYNTDTGGGANDELMATLPNPGIGEYRFAFRFSLNAGPYRYCDADGSDAPGFTEDQAGRLSVTPLGIDQCRLQFPPALETREGVASSTVYGRVWAQTLTDQIGAGANITGELGYGPVNVAPTDAAWQWTAATFHVDTDSNQADEYRATSVGPAAGSYHYAFRFRHQGGAPVYCDLDGSGNGFDSTQAGVLTSKAVDIDQCALAGPAMLYALPGAAPPLAVRGRALVVSVTENAGPRAGIVAELGFGPVGTQPSTGGWTWVASGFESDQGAGDEYVASLPAQAAGTYDVAYRFRYQARPYVYCDLDGSTNGYDVQQAGKLVVAAPAVQACKLQFVDKTSVASGDKVVAYGRVRVNGVTEGVGQGLGVRGQVGVGTQGDDASASGAAWGWKEATFNVDVATGEDEYQAEFQPAYTGTRAVSFRFSVDNGSTWTYCDLDGSDVGGYSAGQQHALSVIAHADVDYCALQFPGTLTQSASGSTTVYGQIFVQGVTPAVGADPSISAELGYGPKVEDPGVSGRWTWLSATYNAGCTNCGANNDEYQASFTGVAAGTYHYAYRFSRNGGLSWCFADLDAGGGGRGFNGENGASENLGVATVTP
ncbi:MAG: IPT/TIG domain-containing protein [Myxococcota bacterium]